MKPNEVYFGKPEGLEQFPEYPIKIKLIREIPVPYANQGDWEAVSYYVPNYARNYDYEYIQELTQIWTVKQINATFKTGQN